MRRFVATDLPEINAWYVARGLPEATTDDLGEIGYIAEGTAVGFLLRTEAKRVAMLDAFVTNPAAPLRKRYDAIAGIASWLCVDATELGVTSLGGFTKSRGILTLARRLGFSQGQTLHTLRRGL